MGEHFNPFTTLLAQTQNAAAPAAAPAPAGQANPFTPAMLGPRSLLSRVFGGGQEVADAANAFQAALQSAMQQGANPAQAFVQAVAAQGAGYAAAIKMGFDPVQFMQGALGTMPPAPQVVQAGNMVASVTPGEEGFTTQPLRLPTIDVQVTADAVTTIDYSTPTPTVTTVQKPKDEKVTYQDVGDAVLVMGERPGPDGKAITRVIASLPKGAAPAAAGAGNTLDDIPSLRIRATGAASGNPTVDALTPEQAAAGLPPATAPGAPNRIEIQMRAAGHTTGNAIIDALTPEQAKVIADQMQAADTSILAELIRSLGGGGGTTAVATPGLDALRAATTPPSAGATATATSTTAAPPVVPAAPKIVGAGTKADPYKTQGVGDIIKKMIWQQIVQSGQSAWVLDTSGVLTQVSPEMAASALKSFGQ